MSRFVRPAFEFDKLPPESDPEARSAQWFDWWCDPDDRPKLVRSVQEHPRQPFRLQSRAPLQNDPAPPLDVPAPQGFRDVLVISRHEDVSHVLRSPNQFSNIPYAALGGAAFLLAQDPPGAVGATDWHGRQRRFIRDMLDGAGDLYPLAERSVEQAALSALVRPQFDLAAWAEQAALRCFAQSYGFAYFDHPLLEDASRAVYRALQYLAVGQHFVTEPGCLPAAQKALGALATRCSELAHDYDTLARAPRNHGPSERRRLPDGVQPLSELGLGGRGLPILARVTRSASELSGRDRAVVLATLLAGTVGNVVSAVCRITERCLDGPTVRPVDITALWVRQQLAHVPPIPLLPRRTRAHHVTLPSGDQVPANTDCLLLLDTADLPRNGLPAGCPHVWGGVEGGPAAVHECLGQSFSVAVTRALLRRVLALDLVKPARDPVTVETLRPERLWGFGVTRYLLQFDRGRQLKQQNLIVSVRVKPPVAENAARLRRLIAAAVPRIEHVLTKFGRLHFAWFEFTENDSRLVLRTVYDGAFDPYVRFFALEAGDLFDGLFEFLEPAPPRPVAQFPDDFVELIRAHNHAPLAGYLYSAYPSVEAHQVRQRAGN